MIGGMDTDRLEASQPDETATTGDDASDGDQPARIRGMFRNALDRVAAQTSERPFVALAAAGAIGYVVGGGLPRWRLLGLLGVGGLVGWGITAVRARMTSGEGASDEESPDVDATATSVPPRSGRHRRKKKHAAPTAG